MQDDGIEPERRDGADRFVRERIGNRFRAGNARHHLRAGGQRERQRGEVRLGRAERLDHRERRPIAERDRFRLGDRAEARRQAEDVEARETDVDACDRIRFEQKLERQPARP